jgi:hypothetical protein
MYIDYFQTNYTVMIKISWCSLKILKQLGILILIIISNGCVNSKLNVNYNGQTILSNINNELQKNFSGLSDQIKNPQVTNLDIYNSNCGLKFNLNKVVINRFSLSTLYKLNQDSIVIRVLNIELCEIVDSNIANEINKAITKKINEQESENIKHFCIDLKENWINYSFQNKNFVLFIHHYGYDSETLKQILNKIENVFYSSFK